MRAAVFCLAALLAAAPAVAAEPDVLFADFEGDTYGDWTTTGTAFGDGPAAGTLPGQMEVSGFRGKRLANSFHGGDGPVGTLTSPEFTVSRRYVAFLVGGGGHVGKTCINLVIDGKVARTTTGPNTRPDGSERLEAAFWDVGEFAGKKARIRVVDDATGGWGHVNLDHVVFTDAKPPADLVAPTRTLTAEKRYLHFPVKNGGKVRHVSVSVGGTEVRAFDVELADGEPDWWASLDVSAWKGQALTLKADRLPDDSKGLSGVTQGDGPPDPEGLYREPLRPQFHFSARRGWLNDPNGLVYLDGRWHLFFQHNPYGTKWGNMHWGHATSPDLFRWEEHDTALYPDRFGPMFSGSAVVDRDNTSGLGKDGKAPLVLAYTAAGDPAVQCIASSTDSGRTFTKFAGNPVVKNITPGNRDPKVIWHTPTKRWVMALYVGHEAAGKPRRDAIHFLTSPDLKEWTPTGSIDGFFECPDLFELPIAGEPGKSKWVLTAADSDYMLGTFDGKEFKPETAKLKGHRGKGFYAAQTFSDVPAKDGRPIQVGWLQAESPGMAFNQCMSVPLALRLLPTADGPRLAWSPVKELESLRAKSHTFGPLDLKPGADNPAAGVAADLVDARLEFEPGDAAEVALTVRGVAVRYDCKKQEVSVNGLRAPAPARDGKVRLTVLLDRTCAEVFAADGLAYLPLPVIPKTSEKGVTLSAAGGAARGVRLEVHELRGAWAR